MRVKDILKLAMEFVGEWQLLQKLERQDLQNLQNKDGSDAEAVIEFNAVEQDKLKKFVSCFNMVNQEIAGDYLPFLTKENVETSNGMILFSDLSKQVINIYEVKDRFGFNLEFKVLSNFVETKKSAKTVVYSFLPKDLQIDDKIEYFNGLSARVYAYGVASEFLLVSGLSSDAEIWEERFKESLFVLSRKRGEHRLPKRDWL